MYLIISIHNTMGTYKKKNDIPIFYRIHHMVRALLKSLTFSFSVLI